MNETISWWTEQFPLIDGYGAIVPRFTGTISVVASSIIIYLIIRSDDKLGSVYHRIMFGMSIADVISSTAMALSSLPMPRDLTPYNLKYADVWVGTRLGNKGTCSAQGFSFFFGINAMFAYNGMLCLYYAFTIAFRMKEYKVVRFIEPIMHIFSIGLALTVSIINLIAGSYNPNGREAWCTVSGPSRALGGSKVRNMIYLVLSLFLLALTMISFSCVIGRFMHTAAMLRKLSHKTPNSPAASVLVEVSANTKVVLIQALAYISALLITLSTPIARAIVYNEPVWLPRLQLFLLPLQGLFNAIIFISHKIYNYRRIHPKTSRYEVFCKLFAGDVNDHILLSQMSVLETHNNREEEIEVENDEDYDSHLWSGLSQSSGSVNSSLVESRDENQSMFGISTISSTSESKVSQPSSPVIASSSEIKRQGYIGRRR
jgi:hypothetical protein